MQTVYKKTPRYICRGLVRTTDVPSDCCSIRAPVADEMVVNAFFAALQPTELDALDAILKEQQQEHQRLEKQWAQRLQRARYEVQLAQRQYDAVDPDNRLVAAELERRWEAMLQQLRQTEEAHHHFQQTPPPQEIPFELRAQLQQIGKQLPQLWPQLTHAQKKRLLRALISHVIVRRPQWDMIQVRIVWISGCYTDETAWTPIHRQAEVSNFEDLVERVHQLWQQRLGDEAIAAHLTAEGFHSARAEQVTPLTVMKIRLQHKWYLPFERIRRGEQMEGYLTVSQLANRLNIPYRRGYALIYQQIIPAAVVLRDPVYLVPDDSALIAQLELYVSEHKWKRK